MTVARNAATAYEAVVYDLDGTLAGLAVDWAEVHRDVASVFDERGLDTEGMDLWDLLKRSRETATLAETVEATIADHEREGARNSERLPCADRLVGHPTDLPVGVCSLNCESACRLALERHDLAGQVGTVVGRDTVATEKPDPEPLLATLRGLNAPPERSVFVGDSEQDEIAAERAGVPFQWAETWLSD